MEESKMKSAAQYPDTTYVQGQEVSDTNYMSEVEQTDEDAIKMYIALEKHELAAMLTECNKHLKRLGPHLKTATKMVSDEREIIRLDFPVRYKSDGKHWIAINEFYDLTGYGNTKEEAKESILVAIKEILESTKPDHFVEPPMLDGEFAEWTHGIDCPYNLERDGLWEYVHDEDVKITTAQLQEQFLEAEARRMA